MRRESEAGGVTSPSESPAVQRIVKLIDANTLNANDSTVSTANLNEAEITLAKKYSDLLCVLLDQASGINLTNEMIRTIIANADEQKIFQRVHLIKFLYNKAGGNVPSDMVAAALKNPYPSDAQCLLNNKRYCLERDLQTVRAVLTHLCCNYLNFTLQSLIDLGISTEENTSKVLAYSHNKLGALWEVIEEIRKKYLSHAAFKGTSQNIFDKLIAESDPKQFVAKCIAQHERPLVSAVTSTGLFSPTNSTMRQHQSTASTTNNTAEEFEPDPHT